MKYCSSSITTLHAENPVINLPNCLLRVSKTFIDWEHWLKCEFRDAGKLWLGSITISRAESWTQEPCAFGFLNHASAEYSNVYMERNLDTGPIWNQDLRSSATIWAARLMMQGLDSNGSKWFIHPTMEKSQPSFYKYSWNGKMKQLHSWGRSRHRQPFPSSQALQKHYRKLVLDQIHSQSRPTMKLLPYILHSQIFYNNTLQYPDSQSFHVVTYGKAEGCKCIYM